MADSQNKPAIVFDFGGVLIDWSPYYLYRKLLKSDAEIKSFLEEIDFYTWNSQLDKGVPFEQGIAEKCTQFPQYSGLIRAFGERWIETAGEVMSDTLDVLRRLKEKGYALFGLSNWSEVTFDLVKPRMSFLEYLDDYLISGQVLTIKPDPEMFRCLLVITNRPAHECLFIDDNMENILAARELGFQTIRFESAEQLTSELVKMGILA